MMRPSDVSTGAKLTFGFGLMILLLVIAAGAGYLGIAAVRDSLTALYAGIFRPRRGSGTSGSI